MVPQVGCSCRDLVQLTILRGVFEMGGFSIGKAFLELIVRALLPTSRTPFITFGGRQRFRVEPIVFAFFAIIIALTVASHVVSYIYTRGFAGGLDGRRSQPCVMPEC